MSLEHKISEELKKAIKDTDQVRMDALRSIRAVILEFQKSGTGKELNEEEEIKILNSLAKKRKEAIELYEKGGRTELAEKERQELILIQSFLPKQMTKSEIRSFLANVINELKAQSLRDLGKVMGRAMQELKGKADGNLVQSIAKELLSQSSK